MEVTQRQGICMVKLNGADLGDPLTLHKRFEEVIIHDGARKLLVDLSDVAYMNSMQIGAVVGLHVLAYENLSVVKFVGLHQRIKSLFTLLGVDTLLDMHYARARTALESFGIYEPEDGPEEPAGSSESAGAAPSEEASGSSEGA
ncbi:MAG: STAS domain-containing protein [Planctomycetota bacterium]